MMAFKNALHNLQKSINIHKIIIAILLVVVTGQYVLLLSYPKRISIDIPPDPRIASTIKPGYRYPSTVYAFTAMVFQYINNWPEDGAVNYRQQRNAMRNYLTPRFYEQLKADYAEKLQQGELGGRKRRFALVDGGMFSADSVKVIDEGWIVTIAFDLEEKVLDTVVKTARIEYQLLVKKYYLDLNANPYQLAIDSFVGAPQTIERSHE